MIVIDTSAIVSVMLKEPGHERIADLIAESDCKISPATVLETTMVMSRTIADPRSDIAEYLKETAIELVPTDSTQADIAQDAFMKFGKGRHPARLNFGDCFSYAAAKALNAPLLYTGGGFAKTDIRST